MNLCFLLQQFLADMKLFNFFFSEIAHSKTSTNELLAPITSSLFSPLLLFFLPALLPLPPLLPCCVRVAGVTLAHLSLG